MQQILPFSIQCLGSGSQDYLSNVLITEFEHHNQCDQCDSSSVQNPILNETNIPFPQMAVPGPFNYTTSILQSNALQCSFAMPVRLGRSGRVCDAV